MSISLEKTKATKESSSQYPSIFDVPAEHRAAKVQFLFKNSNFDFKITAQKFNCLTENRFLTQCAEPLFKKPRYSQSINDDAFNVLLHFQEKVDQKLQIQDFTPV